jgi:hypothetical protein
MGRRAQFAHRDYRYGRFRTDAINASETDCLAGVMRLELEYPCAQDVFEIVMNSRRLRHKGATRDYCVRCGVGHAARAWCQDLSRCARTHFVDR